MFASALRSRVGAPGRASAFVFTTVLFGVPLAAQGPAFDSPGLPSISTGGQTTRFSTEFNPAFGVVVDGVADFLDSALDDGYDASLRLFELNASAYVDPNAWAWVVLTSEDLETPVLEEAAVEYIGFEGSSTVKLGRMFVDFGKQMLSHLEELRTLERPLVLREFLGEELAGTGVVWDDWFAAGDETPVRVSLGVYGALIGEGHADEGEESEPEALVPDRRDVDELSFSARVTGMTDVGERGMFQLGASAIVVPEFAFAFDELESGGLSRTVVGLDATFQTRNETGDASWLLGGELLFADGGLSAAVDDPVTPTALTVVDDDATGFFAFVDRAWGRQHSAGIQFSRADSFEDPSEAEHELDLYYTQHLTEFRRMRVGVTLGEEAGEDFQRVYLQFTAFFGNHSHGLNW